MLSPSMSLAITGGLQIKRGSAIAHDRWRVNRPGGAKPPDCAQKVLIHLDSRTVAMEVGIR